MKIEITRNAHGTFEIAAHGKMTDRLNWSEALAITAALIMPGEPRELEWLETTEQRNRKAERMYQRERELNALEAGKPV